MTIEKKLMATFGGLALLLGVLSYNSIAVLHRMNSLIVVSTTKTSPKLELFGIVNTAKSEMLTAQRGVVLYNAIGDLARVEPAKKQFHDSEQKMKTALEKVQPLIISDEGKQLWSSINKSLQTLDPGFEGVVRLSQEGKAKEAVAFGVTNTVPIYNQISTSVERLNSLTHDLMEKDQSSGAAEYSFSSTITWILAALAAALGGFALVTIHAINRSLRHQASAMAACSEQVASAAEQISSCSVSLSQGATEQAASLEETSACSQEISSVAQKNHQDSLAAAESMRHTAELIAEANKDLKTTTQSIEEMSSTSEKMAQIIRTIDEIAFQTNILALNAAIEAARAGEVGLSFAVVADEVRNLAQRSSQAAQDTAALITESISRSNDGKKKLGCVASVVQAVTESAGQVKELLDGVTRGSDEQAIGLQQISKALAQLEQVTQQTASGAEQSAAAGEQLTAQASGMRDSVTELRAMVGSEAR
ncbi:MAG TPA: methyl-accepting chemotaxis protein [Bryobacteraceae bacterium]